MRDKYAKKLCSTVIFLCLEENFLEVIKILPHG